jgi:hypothetical protein
LIIRNIPFLRLYLVDESVGMVLGGEERVDKPFTDRVVGYLQIHKVFRVKVSHN